MGWCEGIVRGEGVWCVDSEGVKAYGVATVRGGEVWCVDSEG